MDMMRTQLQQQVMSELAVYDSVSDEVLLHHIDEIICQQGRQQHFSLNQKMQYRKDIYNAIRGLDIIQELLEDDTVTEIMVNGYRDIFIEQCGNRQQYGESGGPDSQCHAVIERTA